MAPGADEIIVTRVLDCITYCSFCSNRILFSTTITRLRKTDVLVQREKTNLSRINAQNDIT